MLNSLLRICIYLLAPVVGWWCQDTFRFEQVNSSKVEQLLSSNKSHKSCEHDQKLHPKILKISARVILLPVSRIINSTIISCYPVRWKMGQITTFFFKKGDELSKKNYRPITVLPVLNNICETILSNQLMNIEIIIAVRPSYYVKWTIGGLAYIKGKFLL